MARKKSSVGGIVALVVIVGVLAVVGAVVSAIQKVGEALGPTLSVVAVVLVFVVLPIAVIVGYYVYKAKKKEARLAYLRNKYGDEDIVQHIMKGHFWQDQTEEQLIESIGRPASIDKKVLKTKRKEIWKYRHQGGNRYGLRITLENGLVVGWDQKS